MEPVSYSPGPGIVAAGNSDDAEYNAFLLRLQERFMANFMAGDGHLFTTDANPDQLWNEYLMAFDQEQRQHHNCNACRHFIQRFGGLVTINEHGHQSSALWHAADAYGPYITAIANLQARASRAKVTGVYLWEQILNQFGTLRTGKWTHMAVTAPLLKKHPLKTAHERMAELREDYKNVARALEEFPEPVVKAAQTLLLADTLDRSEKALGPVRWLAGLHTARSLFKGPQRNNVLWKAIASAPAGFAHPRSSMAGTLLEDIAAGKPFEEVARAWKAKMDPLQYQRPQAAPAAGTIAQAEKAIETMGLQRSLLRRFARLEEVPCIWIPAKPPEAAPSEGVFGHLKPKGAPADLPNIAPPARAMTLDKFRREVLPTAKSIELLVPTSPAGFTSMLTAVHMDAPPILQWDDAERRNPFSFYFWNRGAMASQFGLQGGAWVTVKAITMLPAQWYDPLKYAHQPAGVVFMLDGARETRNPGAGLFPEILRSELHPVRAVIEAYSQAAEAADMDKATACGLGLTKGAGAWGVRVRLVGEAGVTMEYTLDRWD